MAYSSLSKFGSMSLARKLSKLRAKGKLPQARYHLRKIEKRDGESLWNPGYLIIPEKSPKTDAYGWLMEL